jgi:hypothetical protein
MSAANEPFDLTKYTKTSVAMKMTGDGVPYVGDALEQLNMAALALDSAQSGTAVESASVEHEIQPAILAIREARSLLRSALQWCTSTDRTPKPKRTKGRKL